MGPFRAKPDRAAPAARSLAVVDRLRLHGSVGWYLGTYSHISGTIYPMLLTRQKIITYCNAHCIYHILGAAAYWMHLY
jgi:hypothetical protein